jgi:mono/diheme cytochrome c family protein
MFCGNAPAAAAVLAAMSMLTFPLPAAAQKAAAGSSEPTLSAGFKFTEQSGDGLYRSVCQACHMPDGKGAIGAGAYPPLAANPSLQAGRYVIAVVVKGQRAMPPVGAMMTDDQVAAVVNYVRTHFGNAYPDAVTAQDVKALRQ